MRRTLWRNRRGRRALLGGGIAAVIGLLPVGSSAEDKVLQKPPSPKAGHAIAERLCAGCHLIGDASAGSGAATAGIPSFPTIANRPGQTGQHIFSILIQPHTPMPDIQLTRSEIIDIVAYLESLRTNEAVPPLITPEKPSEKPKYPSPS